MPAVAKFGRCVDPFTSSLLIRVLRQKEGGIPGAPKAGRCEVYNPKTQPSAGWPHHLEWNEQHPLVYTPCVGAWNLPSQNRVDRAELGREFGEVGKK